MARRSPARPHDLVLLVRHGQTSTTGTVLPGRAKGLHLADDGRRAGRERCTAASAELEQGHAVYASPLERTRETAAPIGVGGRAEGSHCQGPARVRLRRLDRARSCRRCASGPSGPPVQNRPSVFRFPDGESFAGDAAAHLERARPTSSTTTRARPIVAVSHADPIKAAVAMATGVHLDLFQRIVISPCSITPLLFTAGGPGRAGGELHGRRPAHPRALVDLGATS